MVLIRVFSLFLNISLAQAVAVYAGDTNVSTVSDRERAIELVKSDLSEIARMQSGPVPKLFETVFGVKDLSSLVSWFSSRVKVVKWDNTQTSDRIIAAYLDNAILLGKMYLDVKIPRVFRMMTLIHEASHSYYPDHMWCPNPFLVKAFGKEYDITPSSPYPVPACDGSWNSSYGATYLFLRAVADSCTNCPNEMKAEAKLFSAWFAARILPSPEELISIGTIDSAAAQNEFHSAITSKINSRLDLFEWVAGCLHDSACVAH